MSKPARILAFAGSTRQASLNRKLVAAGARELEQSGAPVTLLELRDYPLPLYDGDLEDREGLPENALRLREIFLRHQAFLIASPEYNSSISPLLKNTIDWVSRAPEGQAGLAPYDGKLAALLAASPGGFGGLRGLVTLRSILGNIGVTVLPQQFALSRAHEAFDSAGRLRDAGQGERLESVVSALRHMLRRIHG